MITRKRLFLTAERDRLVPHWHPEAAVLFAGAGAPIDDALLAAHGLTREEFDQVNNADDLAPGEPTAPAKAEESKAGDRAAAAKAKAAPDETKAVRGPEEKK